MIRMAMLFLLFSSSACFPQADQAAKTPTSQSPLKLSIQYTDGLSSRSRQRSQEIRILRSDYTPPLYLLITNTSERPVVLWEPYCPAGDHMVLQFKTKTSNAIRTATPYWMYTGGMGIDKITTLVPGDSLVFAVDLNWWDMPFQIQPEQVLDVYVRAVYESHKFDPTSLPPARPIPDGFNSVWEGKLETEWDAVEIANLTDCAVPERLGSGQNDILSPEGPYPTSEASGEQPFWSISMWNLCWFTFGALSAALVAGAFFKLRRR